MESGDTPQLWGTRARAGRKIVGDERGQKIYRTCEGAEVTCRCEATPQPPGQAHRHYQPSLAYRNVARASGHVPRRTSLAARPSPRHIRLSSREGRLHRSAACRHPHSASHLLRGRLVTSSIQTAFPSRHTVPGSPSPTCPTPQTRTSPRGSKCPIPPPRPPSPRRAPLAPHTPHCVCPTTSRTPRCKAGRACRTECGRSTCCVRRPWAQRGRGSAEDTGRLDEVGGLPSREDINLFAGGWPALP